MLRKESLFNELSRMSETSNERDLVTRLFNLVRNFYYILDIHNGCDNNLKLFNYLFCDLKKYSIEEIASESYLNERTVRRFKKKTEKIVEALIKTDKQYKNLCRILKSIKELRCQGQILS